jgi:hypothetical protein
MNQWPADRSPCHDIVELYGSSSAEGMA